MAQVGLWVGEGSGRGPVEFAPVDWGSVCQSTAAGEDVTAGACHDAINLLPVIYVKDLHQMLLTL